jgi:hypothetical protein
MALNPQSKTTNMPETILDKVVYYSQLSLFGVLLSIITIAVIVSLTNKIKSK